MRFPLEYQLYFVLSFYYQHVDAIKWLSLSKAASVAVGRTPLVSPSDCQSLHGTLAKQQMRFCRDHPSFMNAVTDGAKWAIAECQFQFRTRRWNCSTLNDHRLFRKKKSKLRAVKLKATEKMQRTEADIPTNVTIVSNDVLDGVKKKKKAVDFFGGKYDVFAATGLPTSTTPASRKPRKNSRPHKKVKNSSKRKKRKYKGLAGPFPVVPFGTRESAFVHAISSAGVAHAITRKCSEGNFDDCGCDRSLRGITKNGFQWSGCSDNVAYGVSLSKRFVDARDTHMVRRSKKLLRRGRRRALRVARALMNLHNNEAGRKLIEDNMRVNCKCHGVSGSCELKTCWKAMPSFREIGELLKGKFDGATEVKADVVNGRAELQPNQQYFKRPTSTDLVYLSKSPEYCEMDLKLGSLGTSGRRCNKGSHSLDGCDLLCCGRGYTTHWQKVEERCECKFHWCCFVKCSTCTRNEQVHTCK